MTGKQTWGNSISSPQYGPMPSTHWSGCPYSPKTSPQLTCKARLVWIWLSRSRQGSRSRGSASSEGTYLSSGTVLPCILAVSPPPHSFPFYLFSFPTQTKFSNLDCKTHKFKFYTVKVLRPCKKDCYIVGCTKLPIPPTSQKSLFQEFSILKYWHTD